MSTFANLPEELSNRLNLFIQTCYVAARLEMLQVDETLQGCAYTNVVSAAVLLKEAITQLGDGVKDLPEIFQRTLQPISILSQHPVEDVGEFNKVMEACLIAAINTIGF